MEKKNKRITGTLYVDENLKKELQIHLRSEGQTFHGAILEEINNIIDNRLPIEKPIESFLDIRKKLIGKYGTIKDAAKSAHISYQGLIQTINLIEKKKEDCQLKKSTISKLLDLLEK